MSTEIGASDAPLGAASRPWIMRARGVTLAELLAVIGIVAFLVALTMSAITAVRNQAVHSVCAENLHQLGLADQLYAMDHDGWVPPATSAETYYLDRTDPPPPPKQAVLDSPSVLRTSLDPYIKADGVWFCPADPYARKNVLWLGQRHQLTSYWFFPRLGGERTTWPPHMRLPANAGEDLDLPLICDATGIPTRDSDPALGGGERAASNHPDDRVNVLSVDLSLSRKSAAYMMGTDR